MSANLPPWHGVFVLSFKSSKVALVHNTKEYGERWKFLVPAALYLAVFVQ
jgi:hypothetical protein